MAKDIISGFREESESTAVLMIKKMTESVTRKGDPFVLYTLTDGVTDIIARQWNTSMQKAQQEGMVPGGLASFTIKKGQYNGETNYTISAACGSEEAVEITDYMKASPESPALMYNELISFAGSISDMLLAATVKDVLAGCRESLLVWPGGKHTHHDMQGGLLWHTIRVTRMVDAACGVYRELNRDVIIAGAILHDLGKIGEIAPGPSGEYIQTIKGALFGHIYLGCEMFRKCAEAKGFSGPMYDSVLHLIASSHGTYEKEAMALPHSLEAFTLAQLDLLDAKGAVYSDVASHMTAGTMSVGIASNGLRIYKS